ncbi:hypothetical protein ACFY8Z_32085 [Streptomyces microflavus]|uniref:hypothetical protein n=1 Tax=Streptomyces microflavus TaxID=1919 RepID=UPI0036E84D07
MSVYCCGSCQQPLTGAVAPGEPLRVPERPMGHEVVSLRMAPGTFKVNFDASLLIFHPDDVPGTALHPDSRRLAGCCGLASPDGPNLVCSGCGVEVGAKESDCWTDNLVALIVSAVTESVASRPSRQ